MSDLIGGVGVVESVRITVQICKPIEVECEIFAPRFYRWKIPKISG